MPDEDQSSANTVSEATADTFSETTHRSWGQKLADSIKGVAVGALLVVVSTGGLWWNESRSAQTIKSLAEGRGAAVTVEAARVDPANEGKLVHVIGDLKTTTKLADPEFGVSANAVRLVRKVEMYQWVEEKKEETKKELGGGETKVTTYHYQQKWLDHANDSSRFRTPSGHQNPQFLYGARTVVAQDATLGAFRPSETPLSHLAASDKLPLEASLAPALSTRLAKPVQVIDDAIYIGPNPSTPRVGDVRVSYAVAKTGTTSLLGRQAGPDILGYQTKAGNELLFARTGSVSADDIFKQAASENKITTWIIRGVVTLVMFAGFYAILYPLVAVADVVPFIGNILGAGAGAVAFFLTVIVAPTVIAIAWLFHRPLVSAIALAVGAALAVAARTLARRRAVARLPAVAPQAMPVR